MAQKGLFRKTAFLVAAGVLFACSPMENTTAIKQKKVITKTEKIEKIDKNISKPEKPKLKRKSPIIAKQKTIQKYNLEVVRKKLMGMDFTRASSQLGQPYFTRKEPPSVIWQYRTPSCIANLFFFEKQKKYKVTHVEFRRRGEAMKATPECLSAVFSKWMGQKEG